MSKYSEKFKDPRWQKKRLEILERDEFSCQICFDTESTLHVHHKYYEGNKDPWNYPNHILVTLCSDCHESEHLNKKDNEAKLIKTLYEIGFMANDLYRITNGFRKFKLTHVSEVVASALEDFLSNKVNHIKIVDDMFKNISKKLKQKKRNG